MKTEEQIITKSDYDEFLKTGSNKRIEIIWEHILSLLTEESRKEALGKGFILKKEEESMDILNLTFEVPDASQSLINDLAVHYAIIICYLD